MGKMRIALDLFEDAVRIKRQNLRRAHPDASPEQIEELIVQWLRHRPGAEEGDAVGRPAHRFGKAD
ncbi:MAG TPA: hypothetical protein VEI94_00330 [Candidatus Bathyarchaeia archaeon]|nr:hypothetical protein [Candidatus Bathyarchaeia archaeon]